MQWDRHLGHRIKLRELYILVCVVETGGIGKAAVRLKMSQPAVSNAIAELERAIGVRLLNRSRQGIEPTPYGCALINRGRAVFDELQQGIRDIEFLADPTAGELRIGCSEALAAGPVLSVVNGLSKQYPRIVFHVLTGDEGQLLRELTGRHIELAITRIADPVSDQNLEVEALFDEPLVVAAGSENPWPRRRGVKLAQLVNEPWTLFPPDTTAGAVVVAAFRACGLEPPRATVFTVSLNMRKALLATGRFLTVLPRAAMLDASGRTQLKVVRTDLPQTRRPTGIITLKSRMMSPLGQLFVERVRSTATSFAYG
jgi:DNA-binding transcriptional LysR family regulator